MSEPFKDFNAETGAAGTGGNPIPPSFMLLCGGQHGKRDIKVNNSIQQDSDRKVLVSAGDL